MKGMHKQSSKKLWLVFLFCIFSFAAFVGTKESFAAVVCRNGYCYDTGDQASGGSCGKSPSTLWWDTCFGLSWQYYEWPANYHGDIVFHGTENSGGDARVSAQCEEYGGFWFLGYEAYNPSTGKSVGYQIAKPKVSMLSGYGGKTQLYPFSGFASGYNESSFKPSQNPYVADYNHGLYLKGKKYGRTEDVYAIFKEEVDSSDGQFSNSDTFNNVNWFCSYKPDPPTPCTDCDDDEEEVLTSYARGRSVVKISSKNWARTAWSKNGDSVTLDLTINEGESKDITFKHRMYAKGENPQNISYLITDLSDNVIDEGFYEYDGVSMEESTSLYNQSITVNQSGLYCQTLTLGYMRPSGPQTRVSTSCINVTVVPAPPDPPELFGRVEVTVGNETLSSEWNGGVDEPAIMDVTIYENESVDVIFKDYLKGVAGSDSTIPYETTNSYYVGRKKTNYYDYTLDKSDTEQEVDMTVVDGVKKTMTICETLKYQFNGVAQSAEACARITLITAEKQLTIPDPQSDLIDFNVKIEPYIALSVSANSLLKAGTVNEFLRVKTSINVVTNSLNGYVASITTNKESSESNPKSLYNRTANAYIEPLEEPVLSGSFPVNRWGFSFDDTDDGNSSSTYRALEPVDSENPYIFGAEDGPSENDYDLFFATKVDVSKPSGAYSGVASAKAVAVPAPNIIDNIDELVYMQDINDAIIATMVTNKQYKLYDRRDGKDYWVAKMEDGTVWMTQNLDYVLRNGDLIIEGDSDARYSDGGIGYITRSTTLDYTDPWATDNPIARTYGNTNYQAGIPISGALSYRPASDPAVGSTVTFESENDAGVKTTTTVIPNYFQHGTIPAYYTSSEECAAQNSVTVEICEHWRAGVYYKKKAVLYSGNIYDENASNSNTTICPTRWTVPSQASFNKIMNNKTMEALLSAPYYMNYSGVYGVKNGSVRWTNWLNTKIKGFMYMYNNTSSDSYLPIMSYPNKYFYSEYDSLLEPQDFTVDNNGLSARFTDVDTSSTNAAITVRCMARRGF